MNKVVNFLEQHVQWVVLGLGGLFVVWMAWAYLISTPVSVDVGSKKAVGPGDVDKIIVDGPVAQLDVKMRDPKVPTLAQSAPLDSFKNAVTLQDYVPTELTGWVFDAPHPDMSGSIRQGPGPINPQIVVSELPSVPPAIMIEDVVSGASNVTPPGQQASATPPAGGNGQPAAAAPVAVVGGVDKIWATVGFKLNIKDLATEFQRIKLPQFISRTAVLNVKLIRQEQLPDNSWGNETEVKKLAITPLQPMPDPKADVQTDKEYLIWAAANQPLILQPPFYDVLQGDKWHVPGETVAAAAPNPGQDAFDPKKKYTAEELKRLTPEQLREWQIEQQKERDEVTKSGQKKSGPSGGSGGGAKGMGGSGAGGGGGHGGGGRHGPNDAGRPPGASPTSGGGYRPSYAGGSTPATPATPTGNETTASTAATATPCPNGEFDPSQSPDWVGWAHDETVTPGHTYRYKIVYEIKNPVFSYGKFCNPVNLALVFAISSDAEKTGWTKEVKIPSRTSFYIAVNPRENSTSVKFDVFAWQGGQKRSKTFEVSPGDIIGAPADGVDFATGWTVVDIGRDAKNATTTYVLLSDPSGTLVRRDFLSDHDNPEYQKDKSSVGGAATPAASASTAGGRE